LSAERLNFGKLFKIIVFPNGSAKGAILFFIADLIALLSKIFILTTENQISLMAINNFSFQ
jgi:hypothetical protein